MSNAILFSTLVNSLVDLGFDAQDFINKIFPNSGWPLITQFIVFGVLVLAGTFLGYKPVKKILEARADYIESNIKQSAELKQEAEKNVTQSLENVASSEIEARKIINDAKEEAIRQHDAIMAETAEEVKKAKLQADVEIEQSKQKALDDIHNEIVNVALDASKAILEREINVKDNTKLVEDFIKEVKN